MCSGPESQDTLALQEIYLCIFLLKGESEKK